MDLENETDGVCDACDGIGEELAIWQGHEVVLTCEECRGTGRVVALIDDDGQLPTNPQ